MAQQTSVRAFPPRTRVRRKGYVPAGLYAGTVISDEGPERVFVSWDLGANSAVGRPPFVPASELELR